ncbi:MAG TPA: ABC transporter ATP-binding protein [Gemmatimonadales bacterium]|nr:ABC transporter ATP-binding protein [Gemmatimonadales bacterium]
MIQFHSVSKRFGDKVVLDEFSLTIPEGETTVLMGFSGTGKSVALKHIVGLLEPDRGHVEVDGQVVSDLSYDELMELRRTIGYVFQFAALFDSLSVRDNLALGLRRQGLSDPVVAERVAESLALVELPDVADRYPAELSGGMRKRVGIARAIALRPRYILYDEPTTGLDPVTTLAMDDLMIRARRELGATSVVVTHDLGSAFAIADRIAFLYEGRIRQVGTVRQIRETTDPLVREFIDPRPGTGGPA